MTETVCSSNPAWLNRALRAYVQKRAFRFDDDAGRGLQSRDFRTGLDLIRAAHGKTGMSWARIAAALSGLGLAGAGLWCIRLAIRDPEPASRMLLLAGGTLCLAAGSLTVVHALGVRVRVTVDGHEIVVEPI